MIKEPSVIERAPRLPVKSQRIEHTARNGRVDRDAIGFVIETLDQMPDYHSVIVAGGCCCSTTSTCCTCSTCSTTA